MTNSKITVALRHQSHTSRCFKHKDGVSLASKSNSRYHVLDWLALPEDVTLQIFTNLNFVDLLTSIRLVCRLWNRISHHPSLLKSRGQLICEQNNQAGVLDDSSLMNLQMKNDFSKIVRLDLRNQVGRNIRIVVNLNIK